MQEHNGPEYKAQVADTHAQQGGMYGGGDGVEWNKLQGCSELYRNLLLRAESHTGLLYSFSNQPADNAGPSCLPDCAQYVDCK